MNFNNFTEPGTSKKLDDDSDILVEVKNLKQKNERTIPRFVQSENYAKAFGMQWNKFKKTQLDSFTKQPISYNRLRTAFGSNLNELKGKKVLEAGCGSGRFTEILLSHGAEVYAFDYSNAVDANYDNNMPHERLTLFQADIRKIPFPENFFDIVICLGVLQHTPSTNQSISELNRVTRSQGKIIFDHYKSNLGHYFSLYIPIWLIIKNIKPSNQMKITDWLTRRFFPIHWYFRKNNLIQFILRRFSPISFYYGQFNLSREQHYEFSRLDTHDKNTDQYKRHMTENKFKKMIEKYNYQSYEINSRGNGLECIALKK